MTVSLIIAYIHDDKLVAMINIKVVLWIKVEKIFSLKTSRLVNVMTSLPCQIEDNCKVAKISLPLQDNFVGFVGKLKTNF